MGKEPKDKQYEAETFTRVLEDDIIEFIAVTDKYVPTHLLNNLNEYGEKQPMLYRHSHPVKRKGGQILGRSLKTEVVDYEGQRALKVKSKMFKITDVQKKAIEYIKAREKAGKPLKVSIGFQEFYNDDGKPIDAQIYEYSLTHIPVCKECIVGVTKLPDNKELEDLEHEIDELQKALDNSTGLVQELEDKNKELKQKAKDFEDKYLDQKDKLKEMEDNQSKMSERLNYLEKKPLIDAIYELEKDDDLLDLYKGWNKEKLLERKKKVEGRSAKIETQTTAEMEEEATSAESKEKLQDQVKTFESQIDTMSDGPAKKALQYMMRMKK